MKQIRRCCILLSLIVLLFFGKTAWSADIGMITQLSGMVTYTNSQGATTPNPVKHFMKLRYGDHLVLSKNSTMQIVFFASGRKETWHGPTSFAVMNSSGQAFTDTADGPRISSIPNVAAAEVRRLSKIIEQSRLNRAGAYMVRGDNSNQGNTELLVQASLGKDELREVKLARATYQLLTKESGQNDIVPELFLFSILADYDQFDEMSELISTMRKKQAGNEEITIFEQWLQEQR